MPKQEPMKEPLRADDPRKPDISKESSTKPNPANEPFTEAHLPYQEVIVCKA
jgi:hypothetical protein